MARSTRETWAARVARWKDSGLTAAEYASKLGVKAHTLKWWRWRLDAKAPTGRAKRALVRRSAEPIGKPAPMASPLTFVEMTAAVDTDRLEVVLASSVRISVRPGFDGATLGRLLDVLEARR
jgi:transposase